MASDHEGCSEAIHPQDEHLRFGYIYVLQAGPYFKIGKTRNAWTRPMGIVKRMLSFQPKLPLGPVRHIGTCACWLSELGAVEGFLHSKFSHCRVIGEWFLLKSKDLEWIFTQDEIPMWEQDMLWEFAKTFDLVPVIPCPS